MSRPAIRAGHVVRDNHDRTGIVLKSAKTPTKAWIREQVDERIASLPSSTPWWHVLPLGGGGVLVPEPLLVYLRGATYEDFVVAIEHGNEHACSELAKLFPVYVAKAAETLRARKAEE